jgi:hypothetical protein
MEHLFSMFAAATAPGRRMELSVGPVATVAVVDLVVVALGQQYTVVVAVVVVLVVVDLVAMVDSYIVREKKNLLKIDQLKKFNT